MNDLDKFRNIRDKFESNYTIIINSLTINDITSLLYKKLEHINQIKDTIRRKYLNDRIYSLIEYFKQFEPDNVNTGLYLLGKDIDVINLNKTYINILKEWSMPNFIFRNGEFFDIDYINSIFFDNDYHDVIKIMNKKLTHTQLNPNKKRIILDQDLSPEFNLVEYINKNTKGKCLLHGVSSITKNFKICDNVILHTNALTDDEIFHEYKKDRMLQVHKEVEEIFGHLMNEKMMHRVLVGKDIQQAIKLNQLKILYCTPKMIKNVTERVPLDLQTFKIIEVLTLEKGDIGDTLGINYNGAIGLTYF